MLRYSTMLLFVTGLFGLAGPRLAQAGVIVGFTGPYAFANWSLVNDTADGYALPSGAGVMIRGGNTGSGDAGTTDFTITSPSEGTVSFSFFYATLDDATFDYAGYLVGPNFYPITDTSNTTGARSFAVTAGERFGFRVGTVDNQFEPAYLTVSDFEAPVPEPSTGLLVLASLAVALATFSYRHRRRGRVGGAPLAVLAGAALAAAPLEAQIHFSGAPVTGQLILTTQVNVSQQARNPAKLTVGQKKTILQRLALTQGGTCVQS